MGGWDSSMKSYRERAVSPRHWAPAESQHSLSPEGAEQTKQMRRGAAWFILNHF